MNDLDNSALSGATYKVLYQIAEHATAGESLYAFSKVLHALLAELMPVRNLYLCLVNARGDGLNFPYYVDERDGDSMQEVDVPLRRGLTEFVLRTQRAQLVDQARFALLQASGEITEATGDLSFCSWLGVPLHFGGKTGGVLTVQSYDSAVQYGAPEAHLLAFVARHVSAAIEKNSPMTRSNRPMPSWSRSRCSDARARPCTACSTSSPLAPAKATRCTPFLPTCMNWCAS